MSDIPFYRTRIGQQFYDRTMPELVRQITRLNDLLENSLKGKSEPMPMTTMETTSRDRSNTAKTASAE